MTLINVDKIHGGRFLYICFWACTRKKLAKVFTFDGLWECQSIVSWWFLVNSSDIGLFSEWTSKMIPYWEICLKRSIPNKPLLVCYMYLYIYHKIQRNVDEYHTWIVWVDIPVRQSTTADFSIHGSRQDYVQQLENQLAVPLSKFFQQFVEDSLRGFCFQMKDYPPKTHA